MQGRFGFRSVPNTDIISRLWYNIISISGKWNSNSKFDSKASSVGLLGQVLFFSGGNWFRITVPWPIYMKGTWLFSNAFSATFFCGTTKSVCSTVICEKSIVQHFSFGTYEHPCAIPYKYGAYTILRNSVPNSWACQIFQFIPLLHIEVLWTLAYTGTCNKVR